MAYSDSLEALRVEFKDMAREVALGAKEDVETYASKMAEDSLRAIASGDPELAKEVALQARLIGEYHRIQATNKTWEIAERAFFVAIKAGMAAI